MSEAINQNVKSKLVEREVIYPINYVMEHFLADPERLEDTDYCWEDLIPSINFEREAKEEGYVECEDDASIYKQVSDKIHLNVGDAAKALGLYEAKGYICEKDGTAIVDTDEEGAWEYAIQESTEGKKAISYQGGWLIVEDEEFYDWEEVCNDALAISQPEVFEWWIVTGWFARILEEHGEFVVTDFMGLTLWGRQCTGQSISLDGVIDKIANDMEILVGQKNHKYWSD